MLVSNKDITDILLQHDKCAEVIAMFGRESVTSTRLLGYDKDHVTFVMTTSSAIGLGYSCFVLVTNEDVYHYIDYMQSIDYIEVDQSTFKVKYRGSYRKGKSFTMKLNELLEKIKNGETL